MSHINYNDEELQTFISSCHCWNEVLTKLDMKTMTRSLQRRIKGAGIQCDNLGAHFDGLHTKFNKFTQEKIAEIVQTNTDWTTVMDLLGYRSCIHLVIIQKKLDKLHIDYEHLNAPENASFQKRYTMEEILVEDSTYVSMSQLLRRLKIERGWKHECAICGLAEWNEKPIPLEIDHIDGRHTNNTYTNLRAICPNCHAQTDTYKGKNMTVYKNNTDRPPKPEPKPRTIPEERKCEGCMNVIDRRYSQCISCKSKAIFESGHFRKVERPSYEQLKEDLVNMSVVKVGKKYGVSDNAIRKWVKTYEKYET